MSAACQGAAGSRADAAAQSALEGWDSSLGMQCRLMMINCKLLVHVMQMQHGQEVTFAILLQSFEHKSLLSPAWEGLLIVYQITTFLCTAAQFVTSAAQDRVPWHPKESSRREEALQCWWHLSGGIWLWWSCLWPPAPWFLARQRLLPRGREGFLHPSPETTLSQGRLCQNQVWISVSLRLQYDPMLLVLCNSHWEKVFQAPVWSFSHMHMLISLAL